MRGKWVKVVAGAAILGTGAYTWHRWQVRKHGPLGFLAEPSRFMRYAIALEAQQVPLYEALYRDAERHEHPHLATGLKKAMDVEQQHLDDLVMHAGRLGVSTSPWRHLGRGLGLISGTLLSKFDTSVALKVIAKIETKAAQDYREAYNHLSDEQLKQLYLGNQVDEETHYTWAKEMLAKKKD